MKALFLLGIGFLQTFYHMLRIRPKAVIGMGGYISVPVVVWGWLMRRKTLIHNADSVLGNANILLKHFANIVAVSFEDTIGAPLGGRVVWTGLPMRADIKAAAKIPYPKPGEKLVITIMGGSQGAQLLSEVIPEAIASLPDTSAIEIHQQARPEGTKTKSQACTRNTEFMRLFGHSSRTPPGRLRNRICSSAGREQAPYMK
jgi:UDP-N-acetylglucosamine--N-acetylmuramyl-(pentapeptide) pyrophosphoryl-undecaprenol N-acetylglucosamine transferase